MRMHEKAKAIIKCFLVINEGEWFTSKEIAEFLGSYNFGLGNYYVSPHQVGGIISRTNGIFSDIEIMKKNNLRRFRYNGDGRADP